MFATAIYPEGKTDCKRNPGGNPTAGYAMSGTPHQGDRISVLIYTRRTFRRGHRKRVVNDRLMKASLISARNVPPLRCPDALPTVGRENAVAGCVDAPKIDICNRVWSGRSTRSNADLSARKVRNKRLEERSLPGLRRRGTAPRERWDACRGPTSGQR